MPSFTTRYVPAVLTKRGSAPIVQNRGSVPAAPSCTHWATIHLIAPSKLACYLFRVGGCWSPTARVQRGPPSFLYIITLGEWPRLPSTARIGRAPFHRARSASKEGTLPLPAPSSKAARCASTGDHQASSPYPSGRISTSSNLIFRWRWLRSIFKSSAVREMFQWCSRNFRAIYSFSNALRASLRES